ncbi:hypothetical protein Q1W71_23735 [Flavobacterium pectinovorum]|uniref:hypothetical protein n=1 Tax=Flavobacterium pectinovorum TaxID=29533 RepID=UPI00265FF690|nr:hypothetical protein [Flavobacterium pectinovorum]WKL47946.1 hypothetical protein Q1W71_23735 [Flavobacterium pectinovorum]
MKFPKTSEDLKNEILESVDKIEEIGDLRIRQLIKILAKVNDEIIIEGVIEVVENEKRTEKIYLDQKNAGRILKELNPKTDSNAELVLNRILKNWNKSVEEIPFWLRDNYGIETLKNVFSILSDKNLTELELDKLKTMKWWLRIKS